MRVDTALDHSPFFRALRSDWREALARSGQVSSVASDTALTSFGAKCDRLVLVRSGAVGLVEGALASPEVIAEDGAGALFGISAVSDAIEQTTTRAIGALEIVSWDRPTLARLELEAPGLRAQLAVRLSIRDRTHTLIRTLRQSRTFQGTSAVVLRRLLARATLAQFGAGEAVCREGDAGDALFQLVSGEVRLLQKDGAGPPRRLGTLYSGSTFGELSLFSGAPRNATVETVTACEVLIIARDEVAGILRESRSFREALHALADERMGGGFGRAPQLIWLVNRTPFDGSIVAQLLAQALARELDAHVLLASPAAPGQARSEVEALAGGTHRVWLALDDAGALEATASADFVLFFADPRAGGAPEELLAGSGLIDAIPSALFLTLDAAAPFPQPFWHKRVVYAHVRAARFAAKARTARRGAVRVKIDVDPSLLSPLLDRASAETRASIARLARAVSGCEVGVALAGGAAFGLAHVALLRGLMREQIPIDIISGVSFGSLVGALLASRGAEALDLLARSGRDLIFISSTAPLSMGATQSFLEKHLRHETLEELEARFFPMAVDIDSAKEHVFRTGPIAPAVRASCSVPGLCAPTLYDGGRYVDGCVANNVPTACLVDEGADFIIASNIIPRPLPRPTHEPHTALGRMFEELSPVGRVRDTIRAFFFMFSVSGNQQSAEADVTFAPSLAFLPTDFAKAPEIIARAEEQLGPVLAEARQRYVALSRGTKGRAR